MLAQGVFFDSHSLRSLPINRKLVTRVFRSLIDSHVIMKSTPRRKYLFTPEFLDVLKHEITHRMPRQIFIHLPDLAVFDISGIGEWTEEELEFYVRKLKDHWVYRTGRNS